MSRKMQSYLVISKDRAKAKKFIEDFAKEQKITNLDIYTFQTEKILGIPDVRSLSEQIFLKPIKGEQKIIVVEAFFGATIEAQNSFLKILEEPPFSTYIFILAKENYFLPTIQSRAKLVELERGLKLTKEEEEYFFKILNDLKTKGVGEKLKLAEDLYKDKERSLEFLEKLIIAAREKMVKGNLDFKREIKILNQYYKEIKQSNVNLRLALENLFLEI